MLDKIRLASPEEVESIHANADITPRSSVYAFERKEGKPDLMVVRPCLEFDPMLMRPESGIARRVAFTWGLEGIARALGNTEYYFNVRCSDEDWIRNVEKFGAVRTSVEPEYRYKKSL